LVQHCSMQPALSSLPCLSPSSRPPTFKSNIEYQRDEVHAGRVAPCSFLVLGLLTQLLRLLAAVSILDEGALAFSILAALAEMATATFGFGGVASAARVSGGETSSILVTCPLFHFISRLTFSCSFLCDFRFTGRPFLLVDLPTLSPFARSPKIVLIYSSWASVPRLLTAACIDVLISDDPLLVGRATCSGRVTEWSIPSSGFAHPSSDPRFRASTPCSTIPLLF
jgi:hypothetical protein